MAEKKHLGPFSFDGERGLLTHDGKSIALGGLAPRCCPRYWRPTALSSARRL